MTNRTFQENIIQADRVYAYCKPVGRDNPKGNSHGITLPESIAQRVPGESPDEYERRIGNAVTLAMYPHLRSTRYATTGEPK